MRYSLRSVKARAYRQYGKKKNNKKSQANLVTAGWQKSKGIQSFSTLRPCFFASVSLSEWLSFFFVFFFWVSVCRVLSFKEIGIKSEIRIFILNLKSMYEVCNVAVMKSMLSQMKYELFCTHVRYIEKQINSLPFGNKRSMFLILQNHCLGYYYEKFSRRVSPFGRWKSERFIFFSIERKK